MLGLFKSKLKSGEYPLPNWMSWRDDGCVIVDGSKGYPMYLAELGVIDDASNPFRQREKITQYWLEVAQRCITEDLRRWAMAHGAKGLHVAWEKHADWLFRRFHAQPGMAERGRAEFRKHYNRIRQLLPNGNRQLVIPKWGGGDLVWKDGYREQNP